MVEPAQPRDRERRVIVGMVRFGRPSAFLARLWHQTATALRALDQLVGPAPIRMAKPPSARGLGGARQAIEHDATGWLARAGPLRLAAFSAGQSHALAP